MKNTEYDTVVNNPYISISTHPVNTTIPDTMISECSYGSVIVEASIREFTTLYSISVSTYPAPGRPGRYMNSPS